MSHVQVIDLRKEFGGLMAVFDVSFAAVPGEILAVIGPNGAGKSTVFNLISGLVAPTAGEIRFEGRALNGLRPHVITGLGVARTFQTVQLFQKMTVLENVMVGRHTKTSYGLFAAALSPAPYTRRGEADPRPGARAVGSGRPGSEGG